MHLQHIPDENARVPHACCVSIIARLGQDTATNIGTLFNKLGIVKTWTRTLFVLLAMHHGLVVKHPHFWQCALQLEMLVAEGSKSNPTGTLTQMMTEDLQKEARCLEEVATKSWIQALTHFTVKARIQLQDPHPKPKLKCQKDQFLMRLFVDKGFKKEDQDN